MKVRVSDRSAGVLPDLGERQAHQHETDENHVGVGYGRSVVMGQLAGHELDPRGVGGTEEEQRHRPILPIRSRATTTSVPMNPTPTASHRAKPILSLSTSGARAMIIRGAVKAIAVAVGKATKPRA
jgi:hypothetical protein